MRPYLSLIICVFFYVNHTLAGIQDIFNYSSQEYDGHSINYDFVQGDDGLLYAGNAYGVLIYDGFNWEKIGLVDGKSALSLGKSESGRIYVGSYSEFGYLEKNEIGKFVYHSLKPLMKNYDIDQVLNIRAKGDSIYFQSRRGVFCFDGEKVHPVIETPYPEAVLNITLLDNEVYAYVFEKGHYKISGIEAKLFRVFQPEKEQYDFGVLNNDTLLFARFGIFKKDGQLFNQKSYAETFTCWLPLPGEKLMVGTIESGIYLLDKNGEEIAHYTKSFGIKDNHIRDLFLDQNGDIWIAYNNGIGLLKWNSPISYVSSSMNLGVEGLGYSSAVLDNKLYIGTSTGLYVLRNWKKNLKNFSSFEKVKNITGAIHYMTIDNGKLLACQESGVFQINDDNALLITDGTWQGAWIWKSGIEKNEAFVGNFIGLSRYKFNGKQWKLSNAIKGFEESSRVMEIDERGIFWVIQGNKGLFRVVLNEAKDSAISVINYADKINVSHQYFADIFRFEGKIIATGDSAAYEIKGDELIRLTEFDSIIKKTSRIRKMDENHLYAIYDDQPHPMRLQDGSWKVFHSDASFLTSPMVGSAEHFNKIDDDYFIIGTQDGFAVYRPSKESNDYKGNCLIREISSIGTLSDSTLQYGMPDSSFSLPYSMNNIRISFGITVFGMKDQIVYETQLSRNGDKNAIWKKVKGNNFKEFTNLKEGDYLFKVRAKKGQFIIGSTAAKFKVLPPWYRTWWAYTFYIVMVLIIGIIIRKRFEFQRKNLVKEKERELEIKERLHNAEKLEIELKNKEEELAYIALTYTQKKELMNTLLNDLEKLSKELDSDHRSQINSIKRSVANNIDDESNWENFQVHFDQKNDNFFQKLKEIDPKISEAYLLFCSYVRMGKSNKDIADLLNISVAAIEKRKYRLKKKWDIPNESSFTDFLREL
jgi:hypothetical protein